MKNKELKTWFGTPRVLAIIGMSRKKDAFSSYVYDELTGKGYTLYCVNPTIGDSAHPVDLEIEKKQFAVTIYPSLKDLPGNELPEGALFFTPKSETQAALEDARRQGVKKFWVQQGTADPETLDWIKAEGLPAVTRHCILMYAEPVKSIHKWHRGFNKLFGRY